MTKYTPSVRALAAAARMRALLVKHNIPLFSHVEEKKCRGCSVTRPFSNFGKHDSHSDTLRSTCKACDSDREANKRRTPLGFCQQLIHHGQREDVKKGRQPQEGERYPKPVEVLAMADDNCYYSGMPLALLAGSGDQASIERLDNARPHVIGNIVLCHLRFNTFNQWTPAKYTFMMEGAHDPVPHDVLMDAVLPPERKAKAKKNIFQYNKDGELKCVKCTVFKDMSWYMAKQIHRGCRSCRLVYDQARKGTVYGALYELLQASKSTAKNSDRKECTLALDDLCDLYVAQKGLCGYSGLRLASTLGDWKISLERVNPRLGYNKLNVVLIVQELNCIDRTIQYADSELVSRGWSKELVEQHREMFALRLSECFDVALVQHE